MSTTVDFATVTNSIASLSISGVTISDIHDLTDSIGLANAILAPKPDDFITDVEITPDEVSKQLLRLSYTLHYNYYHCQIVGGLGGLFNAYQGLITNLALIIKAFANDVTLTGALDNGEPQIGRIGPIMDAAGNQFHGCEISIHVLQFLEV